VRLGAGLAAVVVLAASCSGSEAASDVATSASVTSTTTVVPSSTSAPTTTAVTALTTTTAAPPSTIVPAAACPPAALAVPAPGEPLTIGFVGPRSGPFAPLGAVADGLAAGLFDRRASGHPVELVVVDADPADVAASSTAAQQLVDQGVSAIAGLVSPGVVDALRPLAAATCTPLIGVASPDVVPDPIADPWTTIAGLTAVDEARSWATLATVRGWTSIGVVALDGLRASAQLGALGNVVSAVHANNVPAAPSVAAVLAANPTALVVATQGPFCTEAIAAARAAGFAGPIVVGSGCAAARYLAPIGDSVGEILALGVRKEPGVTPWALDPAVQAFERHLARAAPTVPPALEGVALGYDLAFVVLRAVRVADDAGGASRVAIAEAAWSTDLVPPLALPGARFDLVAPDDLTAVDSVEVRSWSVADQRFAITGERVELEESAPSR
jgi:ABC-type branched-subunit amino acid transport system substrate-binding protein